MDQEVVKSAVASVILFFIGYSIARFYSFMSRVESGLRKIANLIDINGDYLLDAVEDGNRHLAEMSRTAWPVIPKDSLASNRDLDEIHLSQKEASDLLEEARKWIDEASVGQDTKKIIDSDDLL